MEGMVDVLGGRSYWTKERFEATILDRERIKERVVKKKRTASFVDTMLVFFFIFALVLTLLTGGRLVYNNVSIMLKDRKIAELKTKWDMAIDEEQMLMQQLKASFELDRLKQIAFMDLDMITPTEDNIIYFNKTE